MADFIDFIKARAHISRKGKYRFPAVHRSKVTINRSPTERMHRTVNRGCASFSIFPRFFICTLRFYSGRTRRFARIHLEEVGDNPMTIRKMTGGKRDYICF